MATLKDIVSQFNTTPIIFAGSGLSRRYLGLPDWRGLLRIFAEKIRMERFALQAYENMAGSSDDPMHLPRTASLIQKDFEQRWFQAPSIF